LVQVILGVTSEADQSKGPRIQTIEAENPSQTEEENKLDHKLGMNQKELAGESGCRKLASLMSIKKAERQTQKGFRKRKKRGEGPKENAEIQKTSNNPVYTKM